MRKGWPIVAVLAVLGCESKLPSPPPELTVAAGGDGGIAIPSASYTPPWKSSEIVLVVPADDLSDYRLVDRTIQVEAGQIHSAFHVEKPSPTDPPNKQAELIRAAVKRGVTSLIVVPEGDSPELVSALEEARDQKVAIVLLEANVKIPGKPIPAIIFGDYAKIADEMVKALQVDSKTAGFPPEGPAILVRRIPGDRESGPRMKAIELALEKAKVKIVDKIEFKGITEDGQKLLEAAFKRHPNVAIIIADEDQGVNAAVQILNSNQELEDKDPKRNKFVIGGFVLMKSRLSLLEMGSVSLLAERSIVEMAVRSVEDLVAIKSGKAVPEITVFEGKIHRRTVDPADVRMIRKRMEPTSIKGQNMPPQPKAK